MTGQMLVAAPDSVVAKPPHLAATPGSGRGLRFGNPRRFGRLSVQKPENAFAAQGGEPLGVSEEEFIALFKGRKTPIKSALLNQKLLSGVGNIYADEALFRARLRPRRRANTITREQLRELYKAVREVLQEAIKAA